VSPSVSTMRGLVLSIVRERAEPIVSLSSEINSRPGFEISSSQSSHIL